ncbi:MAG: IS701 family transposase [Nitrospirota bacterium]
MDIAGYCRIPHALFESITFLVQVLPLRSVPTFIELVGGAMLTDTGFVTAAYLAIPMKRNWSSYYKWIEKGKWSWVAVGVQMGRLLVRLFPQPLWHLIIDDTLILRSSKKAPGSKIHREHSKKPNRPEFVRGQCWVSLAAVIENGLSAAAIPILSRLMRVEGNSSKLTAAKTLIRVIKPVFEGLSVRLLLDSWYMRGILLRAALGAGLQVIGQVRKDTALFQRPELTTKRGRPRKYGAKYTPEDIEKLPITPAQLFIYGKLQWVRYRSVIAKARFLDGRFVRAVWVSFEDEQGGVTRPRLILATDITLAPREVIEAYAKRWTIEPMFHQTKNGWGWNETWQQSRQTVHRWLHILGIGYALPQILAIKGGPDITLLANTTPWREKDPVTAGRVRSGLVRIFGHFPIRDWWDRKSRKFGPPKEPETAASTPKLPKAA